ncbi:MAG: MFS transporter [Verrucomicrobiota bacterium]
MKQSRLQLPLVSLVILTGLNLVNYLDRYVLSAVLTPIKVSLKLTDTQLGELGVAFMLGYFVTAPIFGYLGDRMSRKGLILSGVLVWCVGTCLSGFAHGFYTLICFRVLVGLGEASYGTLSPAWISDLYIPSKRNHVLSFFYSAIPVGSALGFLFGGFIALHYGWRAAFFLASVPGLFFLTVLAYINEPQRGLSDGASDDLISTLPRLGLLSAYRPLLSCPDYLRVVFGYTAQTFALGAFAFWGPTFLHRVRGLTLLDADKFFGSALVVTGLVATLLGGLWGTYWKKKRSNAYACILALSATLAIPFTLISFTALDPTIFKTAFIFAMFFIFLSTGPTNTLILETVPVGMRASAMAASIFVIHLFGDLSSPYIVGHLSDQLGDLQKAVLYLLPVALAVCALIWSLLALGFRSHTVKPAS